MFSADMLLVFGGLVKYTFNTHLPAMQKKYSKKKTASSPIFSLKDTVLLALYSVVLVNLSMRKDVIYNWCFILNLFGS